MSLSRRAGQTDWGGPTEISADAEHCLQSIGLSSSLSEPLSESRGGGDTVRGQMLANHFETTLVMLMHAIQNIARRAEGLTVGQGFFDESSVLCFLNRSILELPKLEIIIRKMAG